MTQEASKPLDVALDLLVYVPVGLAVTAAEELPKLAEKGRSRVGRHLTMARVVGQFALQQGRRTVEQRFAGPLAAPAGTPTVTEPEPAAPGGSDDRMATATVPVAAATAGTRSPAAAPAPRPGGPLEGPGTTPQPPSGSPGPAPDAARLAIPGYDSLSASQVVQRLAGLSAGELDAVRAYEDAHRGRRTILNRVDQLRGR